MGDFLKCLISSEPTFFYFRSRPREDGSINRIGLFLICESDLVEEDFAIYISFCSEKDNFSKREAFHRLCKHCFKTKNKEILRKISIKNLLRKFGMGQVAERQDLDYEKAEYAYQRILRNILDKTKQGCCCKDNCLELCTSCREKTLEKNL